MSGGCQIRRDVPTGDIGRLLDHLVRTQYDGRRDGDVNYSQRRVAKLIEIIPQAIIVVPSASPRQAIASSERCQQEEPGR
jgi:hypothetical protein